MSTSNATPTRERLTSLDAYRGLVMFLMMAEVLRLCRVSSALPESGFWKFLCWHQSHVQWIGCSLHDLIQPSFSFMVGVALPYSIAAYCIAHLFEGFFAKNLKTNLGQDFFKFAGDAYEPFALGAAVLLLMWLVLLWMYRRKLFLKI